MSDPHGTPRAPSRPSALLVSGHPPGAGSGSSARGRITLGALRGCCGHVDALSLFLPGEQDSADPAVQLVPRPERAGAAARLASLRRGGAFFLPERRAGLDARVGELVAQGRLRDSYDVVWAHSALMARVAAERFGARARVLDIDNVAGSEERRAAEQAPPWSGRGLYRRANARAVAREERRRCAPYDRVVVTSNAESQRLGSVRPPVEVVPNTLAFELEPLAPGRPRSGLLFVGSLEYAPNVDAVRFLVTDVIPRLRALRPDAELTVAGRNPVAEVRELCAAGGVELAADAPSLEPLYRRAAVVVAPMRAGGGTRYKLIEAMAYAAPIVATPMAAEGLALQDGHDVRLAAGPDELAHACHELLGDPEAADRLGAGARAVYDADHRPAAAEHHVRRLVEELLAR